MPRSQADAATMPSTSEGAATRRERSGGAPGQTVRRRAASVGLALVACLLLGARARVPIRLRFEGYLDAPKGSVRPMRDISIQIAKGEPRRLAVTSVVNLAGGALGASILDQIAHYKPALRVVGDRALLDRFAAARPDQLVKLTGNLTAGRYFMVSAVDVEAGSAGGAPSPPS
jgi:hypothetical protein